MFRTLPFVLLAACTTTLDPVQDVSSSVDLGTPIPDHGADEPLELPAEMASGIGHNDGETRELHVYFEYLTPLGDDFEYEGWLIVDGQAIAAGRFNTAGDTHYEVFDLPTAAVAEATMYVLTIEPTVDPDPGPSSTHVLAGAFNDDGIAWQRVDHPAALGTDFADAAGTYILETPSSADVADDYFQGIWFLDPAAGPGAGLDLPTLPAGWTYEAWLLTDSYAISTGTFLDPAGADSDAGGPYAGPDGTPPFPGQDFVNPAVDLYGFRVAVSVEPVPDNAPGPYGVIPLQDGFVEDNGAGVTQDMTNTAWYVPTGGVAR